MRITSASSPIRSRRCSSASDLFARVAQVAEVRDLSIEEPDIESIVREIYGQPR